jgi:hypothetical protein
VIISLPAALGMFIVFRYGVNVPVGDDWALAPLFADAFSGHLSSAELLAQHNEHRPLVPRVLFIVMTALGGWNTRVPMFATLGLMLVVAAGCAWLARQTLGNDPRRYGVPLFLSALILFSPAQWETFLRGFVLMMLIPPLCLVIALVAARTVRSTGRALAIVGASCAIATYSAACGLVLWPIATAVTWWFHKPASRKDAATWAPYAVWCAATLVFYFHDYQRPARHPPLDAALEQPFDVAAGFCAFIGGALSFPMTQWASAVLIGAALITILAAQIWALRRRRDADLTDRAIVWIAIAAYAVCSGVLVAIGRVGFGRGVFTWSRYISLSLWAVVGVIMLGAVLARSSHQDASEAASSLQSRSWWMLVGSVLTLYFLTLQPAFQGCRQLHREYLQNRAILLFSDIATDDEMTRLFPDPGFARTDIEQLRQVGLLTRRAPRVTWALPTRGCEHGAIDALGIVSPDRATAAGWAYLRDVRRPADAVLWTVEREDGPTIVGLSLPTKAREDVTRALSEPRALLTGWTGTFALPTPRNRLRFWAFDVERLSAYTLCPQPGAPGLGTAEPAP